MPRLKLRMVARPRLRRRRHQARVVLQRQVLELDAAGRARTNEFVAAPRKRLVMAHQGKGMLQ